MVDVRNITFEVAIKRHFGDIIGQEILKALESLETNAEDHVIRRALFNALALKDDDDDQTKNAKIKATTNISAYWVWIVLGIKPATDLSQYYKI
ncbi:MAG: hypothetical protein ACFFEY_08510 [Candidatus Thorarchaeota archaeon]